MNPSDSCIQPLKFRFLISNGRWPPHPLIQVSSTGLQIFKYMPTLLPRKNINTISVIYVFVLRPSPSDHRVGFSEAGTNLRTRCRNLVRYVNDQKNKTTQEIRATSRLIIDEIATSGKQSLRKLADLINRSKSSVHRHQQAQAQRNQHPESALWATEAGEAWLKLLMVAVLYSFGMECHVGADRLSRFFKLIRIDTHVGVSPSALRQQLSHMESLLPLFQQQCEKDAPAQPRSAVMAMDETFFGDFMIAGESSRCRTRLRTDTCSTAGLSRKSGWHCRRCSSVYQE